MKNLLITVPRWRKLAACAPEWGAVPNRKYFVLY